MTSPLTVADMGNVQSSHAYEPVSDGWWARATALKREHHMINQELYLLEEGRGVSGSPVNISLEEPNPNALTIGIWLHSMLKRMNNLVSVANFYKDKITSPIGDAYVIALEHMLNLAADSTSDVTTIEVMWELYHWRKLAQTNNPDKIPLTLQIKWWVPVEINMLLAVMHGSSPNFPQSNYVNSSSATAQQKPTHIPAVNDEWQALKELNGWDEQIEDDDSDTDVEARVSPYETHPLICGDRCEDEEMMARSTMSYVDSPISDDYPTIQNPSSYAERSAFTSILCDND